MNKQDLDAIRTRCELETSILQSAIEYFKSEQTKHTAPFRPYYDLVSELLDKQIVRPPKPLKRIPQIGKCQRCKQELIIDDDELHYCPKCGQKVKE